MKSRSIVPVVTIFLALMLPGTAAASTQCPFQVVANTSSSGLMRGQVRICGIPATDADCIAAFDPEGNCCGVADITIVEGVATFAMQVYGDDGTTATDEGMTSGDAFSLKLFDASNNIVLAYPGIFGCWVNTNGAPLPYPFGEPGHVYDFNSGCVQRNQPPLAVCQNIQIPANADCQGAPAAAQVNNGSSDPEDGTAVTLALVPPGPYPLGANSVQLTVTDTQGAADTCDATITVDDMTKPTITCPADIAVSIDQGQCGAMVSFEAPGASDNCSITSVASLPPSGTFFPVGHTMVTSTAIDASGNQQTCTFTVTVNDTQKPTVGCPAPIIVSVPNGQTSAVVIYSVTTYDNCPGLLNVLTPPSGSTFPLGSTDVKCVVTDASGNKDSCTFQVSVVVGNSAPAIDAIAPQSVNEGSNLTFPIAAHDLDGDAGITLSMLNNPGGANFTDNGSGSGTFDWTPSCAQGGLVYSVKFIASDGSAADTETVAITVADIPELVVATPSSVAINYQIGAPLPTPIAVDLSDPGCSGMFAWQAISTQPWLTSDADTGTTHSTVHLTANPAGLSVGDYDATMTFGARVAGKTTFVGTNVVQVHLHVGPAPHDSVWVTSGSSKIGDTVAVDVNFCNNHLSTGISVGLKYSSYNMHVVGASFVGSRVEALGAKSATLDPSNRTICLSAIPFPPEPLIAEGCGLLATLYFVYDSTGSCPNPESTMIESFIVPPGCETMLIDTIPAAVYPSFVPGYVSLICPRQICGVVKNDTGDPLEDATVQLWSSYPSGAFIADAFTGPDGHFCFVNLESDGPFDLRISRPGYCTKILSGITLMGSNLLDVVLDMLPVVKTTPAVKWYWSENAQFAGTLLAPGDVITAVDPDGIVCGKMVVETPGRYNIYVFGDDPTSPGEDEGAIAGDQITFYLNCTCALLVPGQWAPTMTGTRFDANFDCPQKSLDVASSHGVAVMGPTDAVGVPGSEALISFLITNTGLVTDSFEVSASNSEGWLITFSPSELPIVAMPPGAAATVDVLVHIPRGISDMAVTVAFEAKSRTFGSIAAGSATTLSVTTPTDVSEGNAGGIVPTQFSLAQNYPNPFNPETEIAFSLSVGGQVRLEVLNLLGQCVAVLLDEYRPQGITVVHWDHHDSPGAEVPSGTYFYRLTQEGQSVVRKMVLLK